MNAFVGQLLLVPYNFAPFQWTFCAGQLLAISQNTALFSLLGTQYGGDGRSTFGLPNLQGRAAMGQGNGAGLSPYSVGEASGTETVTILLTEMPLHSHNAMGASVHGNQAGPTNHALADAVNGSGAPINLYVNATPTTPMNQSSLGLAGGSLPHNNLMPYLTLNWVIALVGVFPQRG